MDTIVLTWGLVGISTALTLLVGFMVFKVFRNLDRAVEPNMVAMFKTLIDREMQSADFDKQEARMARQERDSATRQIPPWEPPAEPGPLPDDEEPVKIAEL